MKKKGLALFVVLMLLVTTLAFAGVRIGNVQDEFLRVFRQLQIRDAENNEKIAEFSSTAGFDLSRNTSATNTVVDALNLEVSSTGTPAAGLGIGISFQVEDLGGLEEQISIDGVLTTATDGAEDADAVFSHNTAGTMAEALRLVAANSATTSDSATFTFNTTEGNAIEDVVKFTFAGNTAGASGLGMGLTFWLPDDGDATPNQNASIDVLHVDGSDGAEDVKFDFNVMTAGTERKVFSVIGNSSATTSDKVTITANTTETNGLVTNPMLEIVLEETAGEGTDGIGGTISINIDGAAAGNEEAASLDFILTDAGDGTEDLDINLNQFIAGTVTNTTSFDADAGFTLKSGFVKNSETVTTTAEALLVKLDCGKTIYLNHASTGIALFLPAIATVSNGCEFDIIHMTATSDDHSINSNGGADIIVVQSFLADGNAGIADDNADIVSFVDTADTVGDACKITNNGTKWFLRCTGAATGAFSSATS